ncbi:MAG: Gldg family protein [Spirochaetales bacterium]
MKRMSRYLFPLLVLGCSLLFQDLSSRLYHQFDLTKKGLYSLSESSRKILQKFGSQGVRARIFLDETDVDRRKAEELIRLYQENLPSLQYEFISPTKNPLLVQEFGIDRNGIVHWEWQGKRVKTVGFSEEIFTSGLRKLVDPRIYSCYLLKGHGEKDPEEDFPFLRQRLEEENYSIQELNLEETGRIPEDADLVLWLGPKDPLLEREAALLRAYLGGGGRMLICLDPLVAAVSDAKEPFFEILGVELDSDVVVDMRSQLFRGDFFFSKAVRYPEHAITRGLDKISVFPLARSILLKSKRKDVELFPLAETSETAWAEKDKDSLLEESPRFDPSRDRGGPLVLAVAGELKNEDPTLTRKQGRFVLFGDSDFLTDQYVKIGSNLDLFLNSVAWVVDREERISLRPRDPLHHPIILSKKETLLIGVLVLGILPGIWISLEIYRWIKRKDQGRT